MLLKQEDSLKEVFRNLDSLRGEGFVSFEKGLHLDAVGNKKSE